MAGTSFRLVGFKETTDEVINKGTKQLYRDFVEKERTIEVLEQRKQRLIRTGLDAKEKGNIALFRKTTNELNTVETQLRHIQGRCLAVQKQIDVLDHSKERLADVKMAKTITSVNARVISEFGGIEGMSDLARRLETSTIEVDEGVGSMADDLFSGAELLEDLEENELSAKEMSDVWSKYEMEFTDSPVSPIDDVEQLEMRLRLMGSVPLPSSSTAAAKHSTMSV